jgi:hypothetical protein
MKYQLVVGDYDTLLSKNGDALQNYTQMLWVTIKEVGPEILSMGWFLVLRLQDKITT